MKLNMTLQECEQFAQDNDCHDSLKFMAKFPSGTFMCKWIDAYYGLMSIEGVTDENQFISIGTLKQNLGADFSKVVCVPLGVPVGE